MLGPSSSWELSTTIADSRPWGIYICKSLHDDTLNLALRNASPVSRLT